MPEEADKCDEHHAEPKPETLSRQDAIVEQEQDRMANAAAKRWESLSTFHRAPCLRPSIGIGAAGGFGMYALRYLGGAGGKAAFTWGTCVAGMLSATSWYTCRRAMYSRVQNENDLLTRVQAGDREALREYRDLLEKNQAASLAKAQEGGNSSWFRKP